MRLRILAQMLATVVVAGSAMNAAAQPAAPAAAAAALRNAQEQAPEALLGAWKADVAASKYAAARPRNNIRTFSYAQDGKLLVTSITLNAEGRVAMLNWTVQLDGSPGNEFQDRSGSIPTNVVALKKQDERTLILTVSNRGKVTLTGSFKLSEDGRTLTYTYGPTGAENDIIYRKWDMAG